MEFNGSEGKVGEMDSAISVHGYATGLFVGGHGVLIEDGRVENNGNVEERKDLSFVEVDMVFFREGE